MSMKPHTIRLHVKQIVIDRSALNGHAMNEALLAASLDHALRSRLSETGHVSRAEARHDVTSQIAEAILRESARSQYPGVSQPIYAPVPQSHSRVLPVEAVHTSSFEGKA